MPNPPSAAAAEAYVRLKAAEMQLSNCRLLGTAAAAGWAGVCCGAAAASSSASDNACDRWACMRTAVRDSCRESTYGLVTKPAEAAACCFKSFDRWIIIIIQQRAENKGAKVKLTPITDRE
jgi:hypothetical protein